MESVLQTVHHNVLYAQVQPNVKNVWMDIHYLKIKIKLFVLNVFQIVEAVLKANPQIV